MHSSISNSDLSVDQSKAWFKTWVLLIALSLLFFVSYESWLKRNGHDASIVSDEDLWSYYRSRAQNNPDVLVILGASRAQLGLHSETIKQALPTKEVFQLTLNGQYPMATFEALANDETFVGEVWVSLVAQSLEPVYWDMQAGHNQYFDHHSSWDKSNNAFIAAWFESSLRFLHPQLHGETLINNALEAKGFPEPFYVKEYLDLSKSGDYTTLNKAEMVKHFVAQKEQNYKDQPPMSASVWDAQVDKLIESVQKIESRGGRVVFIRMPTDKGHWALDEAYYPQTEYWDKFHQSGKIKTVHFSDHKDLSNFYLPDSSHLDAKDAPIFTSALLEVMAEL